MCQSERNPWIPGFTTCRWSQVGERSFATCQVLLSEMFVPIDLMIRYDRLATARKQAYTESSSSILSTHLFLPSPHRDVSCIKMIQLLSILDPSCKLLRSSSHFLKCQVGHCDSSLPFPRAPEGVFRTTIHSDCRRLLCVAVL